MKVVGLTGGIASGKSTLSKLITESNIPVIDADKIAREIVVPNSKALVQICEEFGRGILNTDGTLNRRELGNIVFSDITKLHSLNSITHPIIKEKIKDEIEIYKEKSVAMCVVDAAILIEGEFTDLVDYIILIYVDIKNQVTRIRNRDNISEGEALGRIQAQMTFGEKEKFADYIIDNDKNLEYTKAQLYNILNEILSSEDVNV